MTRYVAFLRAINVGGHVVRMEELRRLFALSGAGNVETFIASGNVIFDSETTNAAELERRIEERLEKALRFPVATFVRTLPEVAAVVRHKAFPDSELVEGSALYVGFLKAAPGSDSRKAVSSFRTATNDFVIHRREIYWLRRKAGELEVFSGAKLDRSLGVATFRNSTTVRKIAAKYFGGTASGSSAIRRAAGSRCSWTVRRRRS